MIIIVVSLLGPMVNTLQHSAANLRLILARCVHAFVKKGSGSRAHALLPVVAWLTRALTHIRVLAQLAITITLQFELSIGCCGMTGPHGLKASMAASSKSVE